MSTGSSRSLVVVTVCALSFKVQSSSHPCKARTFQIHVSCVLTIFTLLVLILTHLLIYLHDRLRSNCCKVQKQHFSALTFFDDFIVSVRMIPRVIISSATPITFWFSLFSVPFLRLHYISIELFSCMRMNICSYIT